MPVVWRRKVVWWNPGLQNGDWSSFNFRCILFVPENGHTPKPKPVKPATPSPAKRKLPTEEHSAKKVCCILKRTEMCCCFFSSCLVHHATVLQFAQIFLLSCRGLFRSLAAIRFRLRSKQFTATGNAKQTRLPLRQLTHSQKRSVFFCAVKEWTHTHTHTRE